MDSLLAGPCPNHGHERHDGLRCRHFGFQALWKRIKVAQRFEGNVLLLTLWTQAAKQMVSPFCKVLISSKKYLHPHAGCRQTSFSENAMKLDTYLCVSSRAVENLVQKRSRR